MKGSSEIILKTHLDHLDPKKREKLLGYLSKEEKELIEQLPESDSAFAPVFETPKDRIRPIHYSWLLDPIQEYPEEEQSFFLTVLEPIFGTALQKALNIEPAKFIPTPLAKNYLYSFFYKKLCEGHFVLPIAYLPESPMKVLLRLNKNEQIHLIQRLALFDLSLELRQIVETKLLKKIYSFLSEEEKSFLKTLASEKESFSWPRMGLEKWDRSKEHFHSLLHRRGIYRLAVGLYGENKDLIWHLSRHLDIGRGTLLMKSNVQKIPKKVVEGIQAQILEILESSS